MAPKRRLEGKGPADASQRKRAKVDEETRLAQYDPTAVSPHGGGRGCGGGRGGGDGGGGRGSELASASEGSVEPVKRGGGRGLKAVQSSKELAMTTTRRDGSATEAKTKIKAQKLYKVNSSEHVETKVMTEDNRRTTKKDGTVVVSSCTTMKKVCYL